MDDDIAAFARIYEGRKATYDRFVFKLAAVPVDGRLRLLRATSRFIGPGRGDEEPPLPPPRDYGALLLIGVEMSAEEGRSLIEGLVVGETALKLGDFTVSCGPFPDAQSWPYFGRLDWPIPIGRNPRTKWPSRRFCWTVGPGSQPADPKTGKPYPNAFEPAGHLVLPGLPPVVNPVAEIDTWLGLTPELGGMYRQLVRVDLPDYRGRIIGVRIGEVDVDIDIEYGTVGPEGVEHQGTIGDATLETQSTVASTPEGARVGVPTASSRLHYFLVDRVSRDLVDWVEFDALAPQDTPQIVYTSTGAEVTYLLGEGETQFIEWKAAIGEGPAVGEFFESVASFLNTNDGRILLGVSDKGELLGVDAERNEQRLEDLVRTRLEPAPVGIFHRRAEYEGKELLVFAIPKGDNPPYILRRDGSTSRSELLVRRGDKDRPMNRYEIDQYYPARKPQ